MSGPRQKSVPLAALEDALCRQFPGIDFHPNYRPQSVDAITVCSWCPIRKPCARAALDLGDVAGVWAGVWIPRRSGDAEPRAQLEAVLGDA